MTGYDYLVVGGGMAADQAVRAIREIDARGSIGILSAEALAPYDRPPLSKGLWTGAARFEAIFHHLDYGDLGVDLRLGSVVETIRPDEHVIVCAGGVTWAYGKLLLATGCEPRRLAADVADPGDVLAYRTAADYLRLRRAIEEGARRVVIVGGGFIGAELAASLSTVDGVRVTLLFPEPSLWRARLPASLSAFVTAYFRDRGVDVAAGDGVGKVVRGPGGDLEVRTSGGTSKGADLVVSGLGVTPRVTLARDAGLEVADGIVVDRLCRTSAPDVFSAGDVASFPSYDGGRIRIEHEDHAHHHGRAAGASMVGGGEPYDRVPMFYSDLFDLGFEAVGRLDSRLTLVEDWFEPHRQGVVYYLDGTGRVAGVLLWNVWDRVEAARALMREARAWTAEDLRRRIAP